MLLTNQNILLGVCGSIAAYKSPDIVRRLQDLGANVKVVLTSGGEKFVQKLSLEVVSGHHVYCDLWNSEMEHITLAKWADIILIAPASANTIATITSGEATDLLGNIVLATTAKIIVAPAMNKEMLANTATTHNLEILSKRGIAIIESDEGIQACGDIGRGRMPEPIDIANNVASMMQNTTLTGKHVVITLGATIEKIDPVRYISNFSSGKMGVALANACIRFGAKVTLIYGNISIDLPQKSTNIQALSASEMLAQVQNQHMDIFISCAAVADYRVATIAEQKIKKTHTKHLSLDLVPNVDILTTIASSEHKPYCVGFAAETQNIIDHAQEKLTRKNLDMIIANDVSSPATGFGSDENEVVIISRTGEHIQEESIAKMSKQKIANTIIQILAKHYGN